MSALISFFTEEGTSYNLKNKQKVRSWLNRSINSENHRTGELSFIFCSDDYLLDINRKYLNHDTYTDIITFDNSNVPGIIAGDIFISADRVKENALKFGVTETDEMHRVIIHGTLHLLGYGDKTKSDKLLMTLKEDQYLALRDFK